jgi:hypothetical protein
MRKFEVTLTYKSLILNQLNPKNILISKKKIVEVELDDLHCFSPENFCDSVINVQERSEVVRINVVERNKPAKKPLNWITENFGRIYFHNGIPLILNKN